MERVCCKFGVGFIFFLSIVIWGKTAFPSAESERKPAGLVFTDSMGVQKTNNSDAEAEDPASETLKTPRFSTEFKESEMRRKGVQEVSLIASDLGFFPKTIFVSRDVPVRLFVTGASKNVLCIMMDFFQVRKQVRSQKIEEITFTPEQPGRYRFYCPVNGMEGMLVVRELASRTVAEE